MQHSRRNFLKNSSFVSLGFLGLNRFIDGSIPKHFFDDQVFNPGPLIYRQNEILALPEGFSYKVISRQGEIMADGLPSPGAHDGMGVFPLGKDRMILVRNHEISPGPLPYSPFGPTNEHIGKIDKSRIYDFGKGTRTCLGGTTTLVYNELTQKVEIEYLSLVGTIRNCAGGITPWNSWITCEETQLQVGSLDGALEKDHGYNFEVPATEKAGLVEPVPLKQMGRFVHEAVAVHPKESIVYQTEDSDTGLFYRFIPNVKGKLHEGGKLQCLSLKAWKAADTRNWATLTTDKFPAKKEFDVEWIDLEEVESPNNDLRMRGHQKGGARFARGEGIWYGKDELYFACTSGGTKGTGQIFRYKPSRYEGTAREKGAPAKLELYSEPNDSAIYQNCDNLTISPWGDVVLCEDKADARLIGITPNGKNYEIARNVGYRTSEFAGSVFSPSGKTLFVNIQSPGLTIAITGPWRRN